jgi:hypothetical protein
MTNPLRKVAEAGPFYADATVEFGEDLNFDSGLSWTIGVEATKIVMEVQFQYDALAELDAATPNGFYLTFGHAYENLSVFAWSDDDGALPDEVSYGNGQYLYQSITSGTHILRSEVVVAGASRMLLDGAQIATWTNEATEGAQTWIHGFAGLTVQMPPDRRITVVNRVTIWANSVHPQVLIQQGKWTNLVNCYQT